MTEDTKVIFDAGNMAETMGDLDENQDISDMTATETAEDNKMDFHIQMNGYTMRDFESYVIEAAAQKFMGNYSKNGLEKDIENRAVELIGQSIDATLKPITADFMDQPMMPMFRGGLVKPAISLREYVGLCGKDFLTTKVNAKGEPAPGPYDRGEFRIVRIIGEIIDAKFKKEIAKEVKKLSVEIQAAARIELDKVISSERDRLNKAISYSIEAKR